MDKLQMFYELANSQGIETMVPPSMIVAPAPTITPTSAPETVVVIPDVGQLVTSMSILT